MTSVMENSKIEAATANKSLGLVAGEGKLPALVAKAAKEKGYKVVAFALSKNVANLLDKIVDKVHLISPMQLGKNKDLFLSEGLRQVVFIGKIPKLNLLANLTKFDWTAIKELTRLPNFNDDTIQCAMGEFVERQGVKVLTQSEFLRHLFPDVGVLTKRQPTAEEYTDIHFGMRVAKEIARLDIGQTVIVRDRIIIAIEAAEGTDEAIKRAVSYTKAPVVVVKVSKSNQDQRFDIPAVGMTTLQSMYSGQPGGVLALGAKETLVVEKEEMIKFCDQNNISLVVVSANKNDQN